MQHLIGFNTKKGIAVIDLRNILYCCADGSYSDVVLSDETRYKISRALGKIEENLPDHFVRVHHSHIINLDYLVRINSSSPSLAVMSDGEELAISRNRKQELLDHLILL